MSLAAFRYRARFKWWPRVKRWTVCAARGHDAGQVEWYPVHRHGRRWSYNRPCKRCGFEIGCSYESLRGIYEYEPGVRHNGRRGVDALVEEAMESQEVSP